MSVLPVKIWNLDSVGQRALCLRLTLLSALVVASLLGCNSKSGDEACSDGAKSPGETDVDCGGACLGCDATEACANNDDCLSLQCEEELVCAAPANDLIFFQAVSPSQVSSTEDTDIEVSLQIASDESVRAVWLTADDGTRTDLQLLGQATVNATAPKLVVLSARVPAGLANGSYGLGIQGSSGSVVSAADALKIISETKTAKECPAFDCSGCEPGCDFTTTCDASCNCTCNCDCSSAEGRVCGGVTNTCSTGLECCVCTGAEPGCEGINPPDFVCMSAENAISAHCVQ